MTRYKNLTLAKQHAARTMQWVFDDENGTGFVVVNANLAQELIDSGLVPLFQPFSLLRH